MVKAVQKKSVKSVERKSMPVSIIIILVWIGFSAVSSLSKQFDLNTLVVFKALYGDAFGLLRYLFVFVLIGLYGTFIYAFIKRRKWSVDYFTYFMVYLIFQFIVEFSFTALNMNKVLSAMDIPSELTTGFFVGVYAVIGVIALVVNLVMIYFVRKHRDFFDS